MHRSPHEIRASTTKTMQNTDSEQLNTKTLGIDAELFVLPVCQTWRTGDPHTASEVKLF